MKYLIASLLVFVVSACGANANILKGFAYEQENPQNFAGINQMVIEWKEPEKDGEFQVIPTRVITTFGNNSKGFDLAFEMSDGTVLNLNATEFDTGNAFEVRAGVEKALADQFGNVAPSVVDAVTRAILGGGLPDDGGD